MKKIITLVSVCVLMALHWNASAQCTIDNTDTTSGYSPATLPCIVQGTVYGQSLQIHIPTSTTYQGLPVTIDSVHLSGITGLPAGINYSLNPSSGTVNGGATGCIWFSGTTSAAVNSYTLTLSGKAYVSVFGVDTSAPLSALPATYNSYVVSVCAPAAISCDTLSNFTANDTPLYYQWQSPGVGYVSGTGAISSGGTSYPDDMIGEGFTSVVGATVSGALMYFSYITVNPGDSNTNVTINAYDNTGSDAFGNPGPSASPIASATVTLGQIANDVTTTYNSGFITPTAVTFSSPPTLTTAVFYIAVVLPTSTGDTLVLFSTTGNQTGGNGFQDIPTAGGWYPYDSLVGGIVSLSNFMSGIACAPPAAPVAAFTATGATGCAPLSVSFTDASTNNPTSWSWSFPGGNPSTSTAQNPTVLYPTAGTWSVSLTATNANGTNTFTSGATFVTAYASPTASTSTVNASTSTATDGSATVTATGGSGSYTYSWNNGGTTATITVGAGSYNVTVTDGNGCTVSDTATVSFNVGISPVGAGTQVKIYPNPANDVLNLEWNAQTEAEVNVLDVTGKIIRTLVINGSLVNKIDIHDLASGSYIIRITDKQTSQQQALMFSKF